LQAPLCAVRAGQRVKLVFYIEEDKRKDKKKPSEKELRVCNPLCAPSAQDKRKDWYSILKKNKINKQENKKREGLRVCKPLYAPSAQDKD